MNWDEHIQELSYWPELLPNSDIQQPPTLEIIELAIKLAKDLKSEKPPTRILPDGEGGIVFEYYDYKIYFIIQINKDKSIEQKLFRNCCLEKIDHKFNKENFLLNENN